MQAHKLMEGSVDMCSLNPLLHVVLGHFCLAVGSEQVWGCIDECVSMCL